MTEGPPPSVSAELIGKVLNKMNFSKAAGPAGIIVEMLKAVGEEGVELMRELAEVVFSSSLIPAEWEESILLSVFKGKGVALDCGNYCGLKLTDQVLKLLEHMFDSHTLQDGETLILCSMVLCLAEETMTPSPLHASCKRSMLLPTSHSTLPLLTWRRLLTVCRGRCCGGC